MTRPMPAMVIVSLLVAAACSGDDGSTLDTGPSTDTATGAPGSSTAGDDDGTPGSSDSAMGSSSAADSSSGAADDASTSAADDTAGSGGDTAGSDTGAAAPTWDGFAAGFFETYCWECHGPGDALRDYSMLTAVMAESNAIRCGTAPAGAGLAGCEGEPPEEQFPIGATVPTAEERAMLVAWIDAGLPEN